MQAWQQADNCLMSILEQFTVHTEDMSHEDIYSSRAADQRGIHHRKTDLFQHEQSYELFQPIRSPYSSPAKHFIHNFLLVSNPLSIKIPTDMFLLFIQPGVSVILRKSLLGGRIDKKGTLCYNDKLFCTPFRSSFSEERKRLFAR